MQPALLTLPEEWGRRRPEELAPHEFLELTELIFGRKAEPESGSRKVWRKAHHGA